MQAAKLVSVDANGVEDVAFDTLVVPVVVTDAAVYVLGDSLVKIGPRPAMPGMWVPPLPQGMTPTLRPGPNAGDVNVITPGNTDPNTGNPTPPPPPSVGDQIPEIVIGPNGIAVLWHNITNITYQPPLGGQGGGQNIITFQPPWNGTVPGVGGIFIKPAPKPAPAPDPAQ